MSDEIGGAGVRRFGSIERTLEGGARLDIGRVFSEAWELVPGTKGIFIGGFVAVYAVVAVITLVLGFLLGGVGVTGDGGLGALILELVIIAVLYPFLAGVILVGVRRACGAPIAFGQLTAHYDETLRIVGLTLLMGLLIAIGIVLLILPGIYLGVAYTFALPLMVDHRMSIWDAMETSRKVVTKHWLSVFAILLVSGIVLAVSALLLLIPLIWTLPWAILALAIVYRDLLGPGDVVDREGAAP